MSPVNAEVLINKEVQELKVDVLVPPTLSRSNNDKNYYNNHFKTKLLEDLQIFPFKVRNMWELEFANFGQK